MDLVLGLSEETWEEESVSGDGDAEVAEGPGPGSGEVDDDGLDRSDSVKKVRKVSHALEAAEYLAREKASAAKEEGLVRSVKGTSNRTLGALEEQKSYVVNVEDLQIPTTTAKENTVPTFSSSRVLSAVRLGKSMDASGKASLTKATKGKGKGLDPKPSPGQQSGKHSQFMARYGLQKYANLFKPV